MRKGVVAALTGLLFTVTGDRHASGQISVDVYKIIRMNATLELRVVYREGEEDPTAVIIGVPELGICRAEPGFEYFCRGYPTFEMTKETRQLMKRIRNEYRKSQEEEKSITEEQTMLIG